jgi:hypothetical protein
VMEAVNAHRKGVNVTFDIFSVGIIDLTALSES